MKRTDIWSIGVSELIVPLALAQFDCAASAKRRAVAVQPAGATRFEGACSVTDRIIQHSGHCQGLWPLCILEPLHKRQLTAKRSAGKEFANKEGYTAQVTG